MREGTTILLRSIIKAARESPTTIRTDAPNSGVGIAVAENPPSALWVPSVTEFVYRTRTPKFPLLVFAPLVQQVLVEQVGEPVGVQVPVPAAEVIEQTPGVLLG